MKKFKNFQPQGVCPVPVGVSRRALKVRITAAQSASVELAVVEGRKKFSFL